MPTPTARLLRSLEEVSDLDQALGFLGSVIAAQTHDPEDSELWELRLRALRCVGKHLPPKHTGHGGGAHRDRPLVERRLAYKARLIASLRARRFERVLRDWRTEGRRPHVQSLLKLARRERGEDPQLLLRKAHTLLDDLEAALETNEANASALAAARRALERLEPEG
jgi:hypothetical protein